MPQNAPELTERQALLPLRYRWSNRARRLQQPQSPTSDFQVDRYPLRPPPIGDIRRSRMTRAMWRIAMPASERVGLAYAKSVEGAITGQVIIVE